MMTQVRVRRGPPPWLPVPADGFAVVFRRLSSPGLSEAHTQTFCTHGGTQLARYCTPCFFVSLLCTHTPEKPPPPTPQVCVSVCMCVCVYAAIISNHISVFSLGVCELPPPGRPICVVVAVMVMASEMSVLPATFPPMMPFFTC